MTPASTDRLEQRDRGDGLGTPLVEYRSSAYWDIERRDSLDATVNSRGCELLRVVGDFFKEHGGFTLICSVTVLVIVSFACSSLIPVGIALGLIGLYFGAKTWIEHRERHATAEDVLVEREQLRDLLREQGRAVESTQPSSQAAAPTGPEELPQEQTPEAMVDAMIEELQRSSPDQERVQSLLTRLSEIAETLPQEDQVNFKQNAQGRIRQAILALEVG